MEYIMFLVFCFFVVPVLVVVILGVGSVIWECIVYVFSIPYHIYVMYRDLYKDAICVFDKGVTTVERLSSIGSCIFLAIWVVIGLVGLTILGAYIYAYLK